LEQPTESVTEHARLVNYINLKLGAMGQPTSRDTADASLLEIAEPLLRNHHQKDLLLGERLCAVDARIQSFLDSYLGDVCPRGAPRLPAGTFVLDRPGIARILSLPPSGDSFSSLLLKSYRVAQGVLHNPASDRRTTHGIFHIVEGGLPIPADKVAVPKQAFASLLREAVRPPAESMRLPFTSAQPDQSRTFVSLLLRPLVCPGTGTAPRKTMEIRFFAPGTLVSNLDFVEGIFGNGGDPYLPENDAALDVLHWTGHSGCVILAPHLVRMKKMDLGLPHFDAATDRQRRDGMCWRDPDEKYNDGRPFKVACRDVRGVMVTIIADNYFGYCKKEVKTQISFAANLYGSAEEEHSGGALAFATYVLGQDFYGGRTVLLKRTEFQDAMNVLGARVERKAEGYAMDRLYPEICYVPADAEFHVSEGVVSWPKDGQRQQLTLLAGHTYVLPSGYKIHLEKQRGGTAWRLIGSTAEGTFCHKPCTVSGGGKSEISKSIANIILQGPVFVRDYQQDLNAVAEILKRDYATAYKRPPANDRAKRPILSPDRSLGSVIKLLTPSPDYRDDYNDWLRRLPQTIRQLVFTVKRYYRQDWGDDWRSHFTVDRLNGFLGHELKYNNRKLVGNYLRVGYDRDGSWRIFKLRTDFHPAAKVQMEDDISVSIVVPSEHLNDIHPDLAGRSVKLVANCEALLFQRPDDAVHRGVDTQAEADIGDCGTFLSNFEPLTRSTAKQIVEHVAEFDKYSAPMKRLLEEFVAHPATDYVVSSAHPRIVDGQPSKNPRYLQKRPDLVCHRDTYLGEIGVRLSRNISVDRPVYVPVDAVLPGRRNNPPDPSIGLPPLAVYNPIHYQELPELFMDFICSLTGKSPSTTGFGSEGALTKGPFNALWPVVDLNNALVSAIVTGSAAFTTAAGYVGPQFRVEHDISMVVPEIWCRMKAQERDPKFLIENGYLERLGDLVVDRRTVLASRLGYRITKSFADHFLGRMFENPDAIFTEEMLQPEKQDLVAFAEGVDAIVAAQREVACNYFADGSIRGACPPLKALLHVMAYGSYEGASVDDAAVRNLFTREAVLASDWYNERLRVKQERDVALWRRHVESLECFEGDPMRGYFDVSGRLAAARHELERVRSDAYLRELEGTIGADPFEGQV
jgi:phosphoenolpyruvate carboxykinase (diphosphate)